MHSPVPRPHMTEELEKLCRELADPAQHERAEALRRQRSAHVAPRAGDAVKWKGRAREAHPLRLPSRNSPRYTSPSWLVYMPTPCANPEWNSPSYLQPAESHEHGQTCSTFSEYGRKKITAQPPSHQAIRVPTSVSQPTANGMLTSRLFSPVIHDGVT